MMNWTARCALCVALAGIAGVASARVDTPWDGGYLGFHIGDASSSACNSWALSGGAIDSAGTSPFTRRDCSKSAALVGGLEIGENFQHRRFVWGVAAELNYWHGKTVNEAFKFTGAPPPPGTYGYSAKETPGAFAIIGPRIGYAGDTWLPYLRMGGVLSAGGRDSEFFYTPAGATKPAASFGGGKAFSTAGWAAGGGFELGLNGAWSISAEYLHVSLGKGADSTGSCNGTAAACAAFSGITFATSHQGFTSNIFRVGISYWFDYW